MKNFLASTALAASLLCSSASATELACDAGGPYKVDAAPGLVVVNLDASRSVGATGYTWSTNFPGAVIVDPTAPQTVMTVPVTDDCSFNLWVNLTVSNADDCTSCCAQVKLRDKKPPQLFCPEGAKVFCGADVSPDALGFATATDECDANVTVTYKDKIVKNACAADRFDHIIERTWRAVDDDCNVTKCVQLIDVVKNVTFMDILPGVCPNDYDRDACGFLPVAINGLDGFDVKKIQWGSVKLYGIGCTGGPVGAVCLNYADVATPFYGPECECHTAGADGKLDLVAYFRRDRINCELGLDNYAPGTKVRIVVTGRLCDGCKFVAEDCITVQ